MLSSYSVHALQCLAVFAVKCRPLGKSLFRNAVLHHMLLGKRLACEANRGYHIHSMLPSVKPEHVLQRSSVCVVSRNPVKTMHTADFGVICRPDGSTLFRNAALEEQGWRVVTVPWFEWEYQRTKTDKVAYLETKIREAVSQHALNDRLQHQMC